MRMCYDTYSSLAGMYKGNPILTLLVFGLPLSLLSIILYSSCCSDLFDAPEDNDINDETDGSGKYFNHNIGVFIIYMMSSVRL